MRKSLISASVCFGAAVTFLSGLYDIYHHSPTNLFNEIKVYIFASLFTLFPFYLLFKLPAKEIGSEFVVAFGGLLMGFVGSLIYLGEAFSHEPSWGFSIIIAPVTQVLCYLVLRIFIFLTR